MPLDVSKLKLILLQEDLLYKAKEFEKVTIMRASDTSDLLMIRLLEEELKIKEGNSLK